MSALFVMGLLIGYVFDLFFSFLSGFYYLGRYVPLKN